MVVVYEMLANFAAAALWRRLTDRVLGGVLGVSAAILATAVLLRGDADGGELWSGALLAGSRVTFGFFAGMGAHRLWTRGVRPPGGASLALAGTVLVCVLQPPPAFRAPWDLACIVLAIPVLVLVGAGGKLKGWAAWAARQAGRASYAIYLIHVPVWVMGTYVLVKAHLDPARFAPASGLVYFVAVVIGAVALDRLYDAPTRRALAKLIHARLVRAPAAEHLAEAP